jgi:hypothetical protein
MHRVAATELTVVSATQSCVVFAWYVGSEYSRSSRHNIEYYNVRSYCYGAYGGKRHTKLDLQELQRAAKFLCSIIVNLQL